MEHTKRIGIFGGAFNPIHCGHLMIAENARDQFNLTKIIFMPSGQSPTENKAALAPAKQRLEMIRLAIADHPQFELSDYEIKAGGTSYTYRTLEHRRAEHPDEELYFIIGGDSLAYFSNWRYPERILKAAVVLATGRGDVTDQRSKEEVLRLQTRYNPQMQSQTDRIRYFDTPFMEVSSSEIRRRVAAQQSIRYLVPEAVRAYILENRIYQEQSQ